MPASQNPSPPLPGWEREADSAARTGACQASIARALRGKDVLYWAGWKYHKTADVDHAIQARIRRRNPPPRRRRTP